VDAVAVLSLGYSNIGLGWVVGGGGGGTHFVTSDISWASASMGSALEAATASHVAT
jgi:hypothetical protein